MICNFIGLLISIIRVTINIYVVLICDILYIYIDLTSISNDIMIRGTCIRIEKHRIRGV